MDKEIDCNHQEVVRIFEHYTDQQGLKITKAQFQENLTQKMSSELFIRDMEPLLVTGLDWDINKAAALVNDNYICYLSGEDWKGL